MTQPAKQAALAALRNARDWFNEYADLHKAKGTQDGNEKAARNRLRAAEMCAAIEALTAEQSTEGDKKGRAIPFGHLWKDRPWWGEEASDKTRAEYWFRLGRDSALTPQADDGRA